MSRLLNFNNLHLSLLSLIINSMVTVACVYDFQTILTYVGEAQFGFRTYLQSFKVINCFCIISLFLFCLVFRHFDIYWDLRFNYCFDAFKLNLLGNFLKQGHFTSDLSLSGDLCLKFNHCMNNFIIIWFLNNNIYLFLNNVCFHILVFGFIVFNKFFY